MERDEEKKKVAKSARGERKDIFLLFFLLSLLFPSFFSFLFIESFLDPVRFMSLKEFLVTGSFSAFPLLMVALLPSEQSFLSSFFFFPLTSISFPLLFFSIPCFGSRYFTFISLCIRCRLSFRSKSSSLSIRDFSSFFSFNMRLLYLLRAQSSFLSFSFLFTHIIQDPAIPSGLLFLYFFVSIFPLNRQRGERGEE